MPKFPRQYLVWLFISLLILICASVFVCFNNGVEDDFRFLCEVIIIGLSINIFSSIIVMIFLDHRDRKVHTKKVSAILARLSRHAQDLTHLIETSPTPLDAAHLAKINKSLLALKNIEDTHFFELDKSALTVLENLTSTPLTPTSPNLAALSQRLSALSTALSRHS